MIVNLVYRNCLLFVDGRQIQIHPLNMDIPNFTLHVHIDFGKVHKILYYFVVISKRHKQVVSKLHLLPQFSFQFKGVAYNVSVETCGNGSVCICKNI